MRRTVAGLLAILILLAGIWLGAHPAALPGFVRDPLVGDEGTRAVREAIDRVHESYYREIPKDELADDAIAGMVRRLDDRFSHYFDPTEYRRFRAAQNSEYAGVGVTVGPDPRGLRVLEVFDDSPAQHARIERGNVIVEAEGTPLRGKSQEASVALVKGPAGTQVRIVVLDGKQRRALTMTRRTISVPVVEARVRRGPGGRRFGVLTLHQFTSGAHGEVTSALRRFQRRDVDGVVLDLRGNGGGLVREAQLVASAFLRDGPIVTTRGRDVPERTLEAVGDPIAPDLPLVVLVDRHSASASELVAGALQDRKRAVVVGTRTFGKGVFQEVIRLSNGGALDITAGRYFTPSGRNLGGTGVRTGDGVVPRVRARDDGDTRGRDEALEVALRVLARRAR
jgi:carboxyl-terminal processing protease